MHRLVAFAFLAGLATWPVYAQDQTRGRVKGVTDRGGGTLKIDVIAGSDDQMMRLHTQGRVTAVIDAPGESVSAVFFGGPACSGCTSGRGPSGEAAGQAWWRGALEGKNATGANTHFLPGIGIESTKSTVTAASFC